MTTPPRTVLLDVYGVLTMALVDATSVDVEAVRRQLGPLPGLTPVGEADLTIRFVDAPIVHGPLRAIGRDAAASDDAFIVLRGRRQTDVWLQVPVERIGRLPLELVAQRGIRSVPYLLSVVLLSALAKGSIPVHASAFLAEGRGTLVTGWAKGGKTEALLAFAEHGAVYVGDEWVLVSADGTTMTGIHESMRLWDWQLAMVPRIGRRIGTARRIRLGSAAVSARSMRGVAGLPVVGPSAAGDAARRLAAMLDRQRSLQVPPTRVFDGRVAAGAVPLDHVVLIGSSSEPGVTVTSIDGAALAAQTATTVVHELADLVALDLAHRSVFPDRRNPVLDDLEAILIKSLETAVSGHACHEVRHPYPPDIESLYQPMADVLV